MVKKEKVTEEKENKVTKKSNKKPIKKDTKKKEKAKDISPKGIKALKLELQKVRWPNKKEMVKYSIATIIFIIFFGVFFYLIELLMAFLKSVI